MKRHPTVITKMENAKIEFIKNSGMKDYSAEFRIPIRISIKIKDKFRNTNIPIFIPIKIKKEEYEYLMKEMGL